MGCRVVLLGSFKIPFYSLGIIFIYAQTILTAVSIIVLRIRIAQFCRLTITFCSFYKVFFPAVSTVIIIVACVVKIYSSLFSRLGIFRRDSQLNYSTPLFYSLFHCLSISLGKTLFQCAGSSINEVFSLLQAYTTV